MQIYHKITYLFVPAMILLSAGCMEMTNPAPAMNAQPSVPQKEADPARFQGAVEGQTAIDSAIELSKKFAALSEEMANVQMEKERLAVENSKLKEQVARLLPETEQAKKELAEANDLLVEMRIELNNWKSDVLGFREEMREADKVQLETLLKILKVLGGEEEVSAAANSTEPEKGSN